MGEKKKPNREREWEFLTEGGSGYNVLPLELIATHTISHSVNEQSGCQKEEGRKKWKWKTLPLNTHRTGSDPGICTYNHFFS